MELFVTILVTVIIFFLILFFICCYESRYSHHETNSTPINIGFNLPPEVPPVGIAPGGPGQFPAPYPPQNVTPYPPAQAPYPLYESPHFPKPQPMPSALVKEEPPPSYYEATKQ